MKWTPEKRKSAYRKHEWLFTSFPSWAEGRGIKLLDEDLLHIYTMIDEIPSKLRKTCMKRYIDEWFNGKGKMENVSQKENFGRRCANLWLRKYVDELKSKKAH